MSQFTRSEWQPSFVISGQEHKPVLIVTPNGEVKVGEGCTTQQAAQALIDAVAALGGFVPRAAVAQLIEKAERLERKAIPQSRTTSSVFTSDVAALRAALARVGGAS